MTVDDLSDVEEDNLKQVAANIRRPARRIPATTFGATVGAVAVPTVLCLLFVLERSLTEPFDDYGFIEFYKAFGRDITTSSNQVGTGRAHLYRTVEDYQGY